MINEIDHFFMVTTRVEGYFQLFPVISSYFQLPPPPFLSGISHKNILVLRNEELMQ